MTTVSSIKTPQYSHLINFCVCGHDFPSLFLTQLLDDVAVVWIFSSITLETRIFTLELLEIILIVLLSFNCLKLTGGQFRACMDFVQFKVQLM